MDVLKNLGDKYGAHVVAGTIIAVIDGKHVELGLLNHDNVVLNEVGQKLAAVAPLDHDGDTVRGGKRRPKPAAETPADPEPTVEEPAVEHILEVADEVKLEEQIG